MNDEERLEEEFKKVGKRNRRILNKNKRLDPLTMQFPTLTFEYIQHLTLGVYQLKQALPYTKEHLDKDGNYIFELYIKIYIFSHNFINI